MSEIIISVEELELLNQYKETKLKPETILTMIGCLKSTYATIHDLVHIHDTKSVKHGKDWLRGYLSAIEGELNDNR